MKNPALLTVLTTIALAAVTAAGISLAADALRDSTVNTAVALPAAAPRDGEFVLPSDEELRSRLTPLQYDVTQKEDTERPFNNAYWDNKSEGIYVDIVSGEPLFSSTDKFKSGTGWPSFTRPIDAEAINEHTATRVFMKRTD